MAAQESNLPTGSNDFVCGIYLTRVEATVLWNLVGAARGGDASQPERSSEPDAVGAAHQKIFEVLRSVVPEHVKRAVYDGYLQIYLDESRPPANRHLTGEQILDFWESE